MKFEALRRALATGFLLLAAAASAQEPTRIPPETLVPTEEAGELFVALEAMARAGAELPDLPPEMVAGMDPVIDEVFARGEQVPDWSRSSVDLVAALAARDGGISQNMLSVSGQFGPGMMLLLDEPFETLVPQEWVLLWDHGHIEPGEASVTVVTYSSPKVILAERLVMRQQQQAWCRDRSESRIYMDPTVAASELDMIAFFMGVRMQESLEQRPALCSITVEIEPGVYRDSAFDPEGYRLPAFDAEMPSARIVPREPLAARRD